MVTFFTVLQAAAIASSCSVDAFSASFAYGSGKIKIPMISNHIINLIGVSTLALSLLAGSFIRQFIPEIITIWISFAILFILGAIKLLDSIVKSIIRKHSSLDKEIKFSMLSIKFILRLYANPEEAEVDCSRSISPGEASALALALSLDGIAVGLGAALAGINIPAVIITSLIANFLAVTLGCRFGNTLARKTSFNLSWLGGAVLIAMAFVNLW
ncbi:MAG: sporulation membrane protein YtaF [Oscillospiraceae bacterium]|nr:sporulation membrane protein YtaF [Oscillospiraceae bacterium]